MTIASLVEAEGRGDVQPKIARVIYNRLETTPDPAAGCLQIDATVNYALDSELGRGPDRGGPRGRLAVQHLQVPGPAAGPDRGARATRRSRPRSTRPTVPGSTTSLSTWPTGETKFADDYDEFLSSSRSCQRVLRDRVRPVLTMSRTLREVRRPGRPDRPLALAGAAPGRLRALGLDGWQYDAVRVPPAGWRAFLAGLDPATWRGLSLTMPLKREALPLLGSHDEWVSADRCLQHACCSSRTAAGTGTTPT